MKDNNRSNNNKSDHSQKSRQQSGLERGEEAHYGNKEETITWPASQ